MSLKIALYEYNGYDPVSNTQKAQIRVDVLYTRFCYKVVHRYVLVYTVIGFARLHSFHLLKLAV